MENYNDKMKEALDDFAEAIEVGIEKVRVFLRGKNKEEIKESLSLADNTSLRYLCNSIALPTEDYLICQAAKELLEERGQKF